MARTLPTEESLGLAPTDDEMIGGASVAEDDVQISDEDDAGTPELAKPGDDQQRDEVTAKPDAKAGDKAEEKPADEPRTVDVRALQEARSEAREARRQAALLEQRWNEYFAAQNKPKDPEPEPMPGPEDPVARLNWLAEQTAAMNARQDAERRQREEAEQASRAYQQAYQQIEADFTASVAADPTLPEALSALRESQGRELLALGYSIPEAKARIDEMERQHVLYVAQRGLSISDHIKSLASARGWQPKAPDTAQQQAAKKTDLASVAAAQQRHQSLSDAAGGEAVPVLDAKALAKMSDKEFKAWMSKKGNERKFDEIMGG